MQDPYEEVGTKKMAEEMPNLQCVLETRGGPLNTFHRESLVEQVPFDTQGSDLWGICFSKHVTKNVGQESRLNNS